MHWPFFEAFIQTGCLTVIAADGQRRHFGEGDPSATIQFSDPKCLTEILRNPEMNLGKTYVEGRWKPATESDLHAVLHVLRVNFEKTLATNGWSALSQSVTAFLRSWNSLVASRRNVAHHYDLDETLFRACLDHDMHYSCGYFRDPSENLEQAQQAKCRHIARKLCLRPGLRVLDIGCGWGSLALYLAEHHHVHVTGLTLSIEQLKVAEQRAIDSGLSHLVNFQVQDYRVHNGLHDRVASVGMFEHVRACWQGCIQKILRMRRACANQRGYCARSYHRQPATRRRAKSVDSSVHLSRRAYSLSGTGSTRHRTVSFSDRRLGMLARPLRADASGVEQAFSGQQSSVCCHVRRSVLPYVGILPSALPNRFRGRPPRSPPLAAVQG